MAFKNTIFIGLPTYNSIGTIEASIRSILNQTYQDWILVIRDNLSNDGTYEACCQIAKEDSRVLVYRNEENIGAWPNFIRLLNHCEAPYFKWHASDDVISEDFLEVNLNFLTKNPNAIGSFSKDSTLSAIRAGHSFQIHDFRGDIDSKFRKFLLNAANSNAAFYSLFRSEVINTFNFGEKIQDHLIQDWMLVLRVLRAGDIIRCPNGQMVMGERGFSTVKFSWITLLPTSIDKVLPYRSFIKHVYPVVKDLNLANKWFFCKYVTSLHIRIYKGLILFYQSKLIARWHD
jgi:glycosyltransferase involved in cell wall biosynthesis